MLDIGKYEDEINYTGKKRIMMILGIFLAGIVGLIGISNVQGQIIHGFLPTRIVLRSSVLLTLANIRMPLNSRTIWVLPSAVTPMGCGRNWPWSPLSSGGQPFSYCIPGNLLKEEA